MPQLLHFLPCDRVNIDALTGRLSLLYLAENIQPLAQRDPDADDDTPAGQARFLLLPLFVSTHWWRLDGDDGPFEQRLELIAPDERRITVGETAHFRMDAPYHRIFHHALITARLAGVSWFVLSLRKPPGEWNEVARYPIMLEEIPKPPDPTEDVSASPPPTIRYPNSDSSGPQVGAAAEHLADPPIAAAKDSSTPPQTPSLA